MENKDLYFTLHSSIVPVKGAFKSILCDLESQSYREIPNDLVQIFEEFQGKKIIDVYKCFDEGVHQVLDEIFEFLLEMKYIFTSKFVPQINQLSFDSLIFSEEINNSIIDIDENTNLESVKKFVNQLNNFGCKNLSIRLFNGFDNKFFLYEVLSKIRTTTIRYCELTLNYSVIEEKELYNLLKENLRIFYVWVYSAPEEKEIHLEYQKIYYSKKAKVSSNCCGNIDPKYFFSDLNMFTLNKNVNSCLYGKISMDIYGNIKNCPAMTKSFGNVESTNLVSVIKNVTFKEYWGINKDQIEVCKDCEFRYICSDCRAFLETKNDKPLKCKYNPYEGVWE